MKAAFAFGALIATATASGKVQQSGYDKSKCKQKPLVSAEKLESHILEDALLAGAQSLQDFAYAHPDRNRLMGSAGHNDTVKFLVDELNALGGYYTVETQAFWSWVQLSASFSLAIDGNTTAAEIFDFSASGNVTAPLVVVSNLGCDATDYPADLDGNIALISRGTCQFGLKSALAGAAGAVGALIYNNQPGELFGTLGPPGRPEGDYVPTLALTQEQGTSFVEAITGGATITASMDVVTDIQNLTTENVIATSNCGNLNSTLVLGAHTDSVAAGPGINDDGSGTIGILEVAKALAKYKVNNAVRFGFWSGEEIGLLGSTFYVENAPAEELAAIRAYLNFDMIASPNYIYAIYDGDGSAFNETGPGPAGSAEIEKFFENYFSSIGENYTATAFDGRSDYLAFIDAGIPAGGTFTGAEEIKTEEEAAQYGGTAGVAYDENYHQASDTVDNLNVEAFVINAKAIAASVAEYAVSFDSLPPREPASPEKVKRAILAGLKRSQTAHHAKHLGCGKPVSE